MIDNHPYVEEMKIANDFLKENKNHPVITELNDALKNTNGMSHSDIWSIIYDIIYDNFERKDIPREVITGLSYIYEL